MMEDNNENILAQIRQLRTEAGNTLQGNEYFAVANRLDAIMAGGDTGGAVAQDALRMIRTHLVAGAGTSGEPVMAGEGEPQALEEIEAIRAEAANTVDGNVYFALAQKVDALVAGGGLSSPDGQMKLQAIRDGLAAAPAQTANAAPNEILEHILALRAKAGESLQGNGYFGVAHRLDALLAAGDLTSTSARDALDQIRSLIEAGPPAAAPAPASASLQQAPKAEAEAAPEPAAGQTIMFPKANSFGTPQSTVAISFAAAEAEPENEPAQTAFASSSGAAAEASALNSHHAPKPEEKTGFDALTEASWRRVREVAGSDEIPMQAVNSAAAGGMTASQPEPADDMATVVAQAEEIGEPETAEAASEMTGSVEATAEEIRHEPAETSVSSPQQEAAPAEMTEAEISSAAAPEAETPSESETVTASAAYQEPFRVIPRPTIVNRPVKIERFARLKRLAKLPYLPKRKT